jgi:hypothetical protein
MPGSGGLATVVSGPSTIVRKKDHGLTLRGEPTVIRLSKYVSERVLDPRFVVAALVGAFGAAFVFATVTVVRHIGRPAISAHELIE